VHATLPTGAPRAVQLTDLQQRPHWIKVETSAVYNLTTQFGGGKTHALTLLYHPAQDGPVAPMRRTPWGSIAFQLGREEGDSPSLLLLMRGLRTVQDELPNYLNRERRRKMGLGGRYGSMVF
jgi:hypothetical protein